MYWLGLDFTIWGLELGGLGLSTAVNRLQGPELTTGCSRGPQPDSPGPSQNMTGVLLIRRYTSLLAGPKLRSWGASD